MGTGTGTGTGTGMGSSSSRAVSASSVHEEMLSLPKLNQLAKILLGMINHAQQAVQLMTQMTTCIVGKGEAHVAALNHLVGAHNATREGRVVSEQDVDPTKFMQLVLDDVVDPMMKGFKYSGAKLAPMIDAANAKIHQLFTDPKSKAVMKQLLANRDFSSAEGIVNGLPQALWEAIFDESINIFAFFGNSCNDSASASRSLDPATALRWRVSLFALPPPCLLLCLLPLPLLLTQRASHPLPPPQ